MPGRYQCLEDSDGGAAHGLRDPQERLCPGTLRGTEEDGERDGMSLRDSDGETKKGPERGQQQAERGATGDQSIRSARLNHCT